MENYLGEIRPVAFNFAPRGWALCQGQILPINQNTALFSLLGTTYGGNGQTTFALPDLRGRVALGEGQGPGLQNYDLGQVAGTEAVSLVTSQLPAHGHPVMGTITPASTVSPAGRFPAVTPRRVYGTQAADTTFAADTVRLTGGSQPHNNQAPFLVINYIIALVGDYPPRA
jgi:microcystin-dependent protein